MTTVSSSDVPVLPLLDGRTIPQLGFGVWQLPEDRAEAAVSEAFRLGYRHIDTAAIYANERGVGRAITASGLDRGEIFVTTKVWNGDQGRDAAIRACEKSLGRLGLDAVDLYLIHWPAPALDTYVETWEALIALRDEGRARSIGVSNFNPAHLDRIIAATGVAPVLNQIELHPYLQQAELRRHDAAHGILTEAWSPLGAGHGLLDDTVLRSIGDRLGATSAQVVLAWHLALGNVVIPKSITPARIAENLESVRLELSAQDLTDIAALDRGHRYGGDPETSTFV